MSPSATSTENVGFRGPDPRIPPGSGYRFSDFPGKPGFPGPEPGFSPETRLALTPFWTKTGNQAPETDFSGIGANGTTRFQTRIRFSRPETEITPEPWEGPTKALVTALPRQETATAPVARQPGRRVA